MLAYLVCTAFLKGRSCHSISSIVSGKQVVIPLIQHVHLSSYNKSGSICALRTPGPGAMTRDISVVKEVESSSNRNKAMREMELHLFILFPFCSKISSDKLKE